MPMNKERHQLVSSYAHFFSFFLSLLFLHCDLSSSVFFISHPPLLAYNAAPTAIATAMAPNFIPFPFALTAAPVCKLGAPLEVVVARMPVPVGVLAVSPYATTVVDVMVDWPPSGRTVV